MVYAYCNNCNKYVIAVHNIGYGYYCPECGLQLTISEKDKMYNALRFNKVYTKQKIYKLNKKLAVKKQNTVEILKNTVNYSAELKKVKTVKRTIYKTNNGYKISFRKKKEYNYISVEIVSRKNKNVNTIIIPYLALKQITKINKKYKRLTTKAKKVISVMQNYNVLLNKYTVAVALNISHTKAQKLLNTLK